MISRHLESAARRAARRFPAIAVTGPRQSGKTTLCRAIFPDHEYVNLERPDVRAFAREDPNGFLARYPGPVVFDEAQRVPDLFSYLMPLVDEDPTPGRFVLTGSQNFLLMESLSQSLAGRCAILHLLPFSLRELHGRPPRDVTCAGFPVDAADAEGSHPDLLHHLIRGGFPAIHDRGHEPDEWLAQYTRTYVERDVRLSTNVGNLEAFERFVRLCAGRVGQLLNYSALAADCGISVMTAKRWLSVLRTSFTVILLRPHYRNFGKRLIRSPKLYFTDTGLLCYLLGIREARELDVHSMRGGIFESYVVAELTKSYVHQGIESPLYFWRDSTGHEIDLVIERAEQLHPVEIKSGRTVTADMFRTLHWWRDLTGVEKATLVYGGEDVQTRQDVDVCPWFLL